MLILILQLAVSVLTAFLAKRKGYNPFIWFFCAGIFGLIILAFLTNTNAMDVSEEEKPKKIKIGNIIGGVIVCVGLVFFLVNIFVFRVKFKKIAHQAKIAACEGYANQIGLALLQYEQANEDSNPDSLTQPALTKYFPHGKLPKHPMGWSWDKYYDREKKFESRGGKVVGIIDAERACNF